MRKITFGVANSLDNFIARPDHAVDWLQWTNEVAAVSGAFWQTIDTLLLGRKTYEIALEQSKGQTNPYPNIKTYVFSRTLPAGPAGDAQIVGEDAADFVHQLKRQRGKDIGVMGGGDLARALFEADLIDEVTLNIHPVLLGAGVPLFHALSRQVNLKLVEAQTFKNGCLLVTYRVKHRRG